MKQVFLLFTVVGIYACTSKPTITEAAQTSTIAKSTVASSETICYLKTEGPDSIKVQLILNGDKVTGIMHWMPAEKDGAYGTLAGRRVGDSIFVDYNFVIEGDNEIESKIFILKPDKLIELSGELEQKNGKSVMIHPEKAKQGDVLLKADCSKMQFDYE